MLITKFQLHPQLSADTIFITDLPLCRVLLMNNKNFPWLILVPMRAGIREIFDLGTEDYTQAMNEIRKVSQAFADLSKAYKMNIAALGNMVPQLHIHIIARFEGDSAWPKPVWSATEPATKYSAQEAESLIAQIKEKLADS